ncbi:unnamed protein product [Closterium sp. Yama58-4]|nr:unnamed protein product [Closterium sp. Yama58-4]
MAIEFDVLQTKTHDDMKDQHVGLNIQGHDKSITTVKSPFPLANKQAYTAWVDYAPGDPGTVQVFLAKTTVKPEKPLLDRRLSLCAVLKPGPPQPQGEGMQQQPRAFYFGFVASTTVKPFMVQSILRSALRTDASWAFAVASSIEAAYGIATNLEAPQLSVDSLFTAMNLTTQAAKCTAGGSPTDAFKKLVSLPGGAITMEGNKVCHYGIAAVVKATYLAQVCY